MKKIFGLMFLLHLLFYSCDKSEYSIISPDSRLNFTVENSEKGLFYKLNYAAWYYNFENYNLGPERLSETYAVRYL